MATKIILGCLLLVFAVGSVHSLSCLTQADCPDTHCCAKKAFVEGEFNCVLYRQKNELCMVDGLDEKLYDGRYDITCPCVPGLLCQQYFHSDGNMGFIAEANPTCRNVTEDRELERRQRLNGIFSNNNQDTYAYANAGKRK